MSGKTALSSEAALPTKMASSCNVAPSFEPVLSCEAYLSFEGPSSWEKTMFYYSENHKYRLFMGIFNLKTPKWVSISENGCQLFWLVEILTLSGLR